MPGEHAGPVPGGRRDRGEVADLGRHGDPRNWIAGTDARTVVSDYPRLLGYRRKYARVSQRCWLAKTSFEDNGWTARARFNPSKCAVGEPQFTAAHPAWQQFI